MKKIIKRILCFLHIHKNKAFGLTIPDGYLVKRCKWCGKYFVKV